MRAAALAILMVGCIAVGVQAQGPVPRDPIMPKTTAGAELYRFYCSNCHGLDAKGRPATVAMHVPAPNLTILAANHGGVFPREAVRGVIVSGGGAGTAHGTTDMPVWGTIFRALDANDTVVALRIENLVRYIESIQTTGVSTGNAQ